MRITKRDPFTGQVNTMDLNVTDEQLERWERGEDLIQNIMPRLSPDEREFLMTGIMPDTWDELFFEEEDDDDYLIDEDFDEQEEPF